MPAPKQRTRTRPPGITPEAAAQRHRQLLKTFGSGGVRAEWERYEMTASAQYRRELIERFLARHLPRGSRMGLEVAPGPGRFTPMLRPRAKRLVLLDLSRPMLVAGRRRERRGHGQRTHPIQGSLEHPPLRSGSFDWLVALGVLVFTARDFSPVVRGLAALLRPGGLLLAEVRTPTGDTMSLLPRAPLSARKLLRDPVRNHLHTVIREGYQPYDPPHMARFEAGWQRPHQLRSVASEAGLETEDLMTVGPNFSNQPLLLDLLRRDRKAYANALALEEETGRWPELLGAGAGLLFAARRT